MNTCITTPIYYASGAPHLGHAYTTLIADCYRRFYQLNGDRVFLLTGTDEHGQKIERVAAKAGQSPTAFVAERSEEFRRLWVDLEVEIDEFSRTTSADHVAFVLNFWDRLQKAGDLYKGNYEGLYCVDCEQYFTSGDSCPVHRTPLEEFREESWFFRLSRYQQRLITHIEDNPEFILPLARRNEVLAFLKDAELRDLSVSRRSVNWGIGVPGDPEHVIYVWVDALLTYLSGLSALSASSALSGLPENSHDVSSTGVDQLIHFIGKDILIFHAVYWPALL